MRQIVLAALAAGMVAISAVPAQAAGGCERGYHRARHGACVPNWHWRRHRWHRW